jgi:hypothetical protein
MAKRWLVLVAVVLLSGAGCCHDCGCCDWCPWRSDRPLPPPRFEDRPPPSPYGPPAGDVAPPVGPRAPTGAYGGS